MPIKLVDDPRMIEDWESYCKEMREQHHPKSLWPKFEDFCAGWRAMYERAQPDDNAINFHLSNLAKASEAIDLAAKSLRRIARKKALN